LISPEISVNSFKNINSLLAIKFLELWRESACNLVDCMNVVRDYVT